MGQVFWSRGRTMEGGAFPDYGAPFFYAIFVPVKPTHKPLQTVAQQRTQTNYIVLITHHSLTYLPLHNTTT